MGNANLTGPKVNLKSPEENICSLNSDIFGPNESVSQDVTTRLKNNDAYKEITQFCAPLDQITELGTEICNNLGDNGEWVFYETVENQCQYNDCDPGYAVDGRGCNGGCCSIVGGTFSCARRSYHGNPATCCFNDYACDTVDENKCFESPARQSTCDSKFRDLSSETCRNTIEDFCTGKTLFDGQNDWLEMWLENSSVEVNSGVGDDNKVYPATPFSPETSTFQIRERYPMPEKQPCLRAIARNVTLGKICSWDQLQEGEVITSTINPDGINWSRKLLREVYDKYISENGRGLLEGISTDGMNRDSGFYNTLWNICNKIPLLCTDGSDLDGKGILPDLCRNITTEDIIKNPDTLKWCGCHMKEDQYSDYTEKFGIPKECTPMCNRLGVIPAVDINGERKFCLDSTCVIDGNNINLTASQISGGINFNQICPGCGKNNINRTFTKTSRNNNPNSVNAKIDSFTMTNPVRPILLTQYFNNAYGGKYARSNFTNDQLILEVLYTPDDFLSLSGIDLSKFPNDITPLSTGTNPNFKNGVINYLENKYGVSTVTVIFGLINKTNCIGIINAGFQKDINKLTSAQIANIQRNNFNVLYFATADSNGVFQPLAFDTSQTCPGSDNAEYSTGQTFFQVPNKNFNENLVSKTSNKFSSASANSEVTSNTCTCIMDGINLSGANLVVNGSVNFNSECGKSVCYDPSGKLISCAASSTNNDPFTHNTVEQIEIETAMLEEKEKYSTVFYILASFLVLIFILILFFELRK